MAVQRRKAAAKPAAGLAITVSGEAPGHAPAADPIEAAVEALTDPAPTWVHDQATASIEALIPAEPAPHHEAPPAAAAEPVAVVPSLPAVPPPASPDAMRTGYLAAARGVAELNSKAIEMFEAQAVSAVRFAEAVAGLTSVSAAFELHGEQVRRHFELMTDQARQWTALVRKVAESASAPFGTDKAA